MSTFFLRRSCPNRLYRSGSAYAFWRWTDVDSEYITRLHLLKTPLFAICLHWFHKPDPDWHEHDHPVSFLSIILRGWYVEQRNGEHIARVFCNYIHADPSDTHRITDVAENTLTLCLMGPKTREWGFHTPEGWIYWKDYYKKERLQ